MWPFYIILAASWRHWNKDGATAKWVGLWSKLHFRCIEGCFCSHVSELKELFSSDMPQIDSSKSENNNLLLCAPHSFLFKKMIISSRSSDRYSFWTNSNKTFPCDKRSFFQSRFAVSSFKSANSNLVSTKTSLAIKCYLSTKNGFVLVVSMFRKFMQSRCFSWFQLLISLKNVLQNLSFCF